MDNNKKIKTTYVSPGEAVFTREKLRLWTVLGSCVSIIMYHPESGYTGMTHAQLPEYAPSQGSCPKDCPRSCGSRVDSENHLRYVNCSLKYLMNRFNTKKISLKELEVRLYGGSNLFEYSGQKVGDSNVLVAKGLISLYQLKLVASDVGGPRGRTIQFFTEDARTLVKIQRSHIINSDPEIKPEVLKDFPLPLTQP